MLENKESCRSDLIKMALVLYNSQAPKELPCIKLLVEIIEGLQLNNKAIAEYVLSLIFLILPVGNSWDHNLVFFLFRS